MHEARGSETGRSPMRMRPEDAQLREAARRGEPSACLEIAKRLFCGGSGFAQNFKLGLAYLQQELDKGVPSAIWLVGETVPLEVLIGQKCRMALIGAASMGSTIAQLKLGLWMMLRRSGREDGIRWVKSSKFVPEAESWSTVWPGALVHWLKIAKSWRVADPVDVAVMGAHEALEDADIGDACDCIKAALELGAFDDEIADVVVLTVYRTAMSGGAFDLPVDLVECSLSSLCKRGQVEAKYGLGCARGGLNYGHLMPGQLARRIDFRSAAALLLRAADAGKCEAWLNLSEMAPDYLGSAANREMSRFFLEKAAESGVVPAQRKLGALLLKEANCVEEAEPGVHWLDQAARRGDEKAGELLSTLSLPLPQLSPETELSIIEKARSSSHDLAERLALARTFHLTEREALTFDARSSVRPWGLVLQGTTKENPKGRLVPATTPKMKRELSRAAMTFTGAGPTADTIDLQRYRAQRLALKALAISETLFFAHEIGRSLSHYGFGRHWAARAAPLLQSVLASPIRRGEKSLAAGAEFSPSVGTA